MNQPIRPPHISPADWNAMHEDAPTAHEDAPAPRRPDLSPRPSNETTLPYLGVLQPVTVTATLPNGVAYEVTFTLLSDEQEQAVEIVSASPIVRRRTMLAFALRAIDGQPFGDGTNSAEDFTRRLKDISAWPSVLVAAFADAYGAATLEPWLRKEEYLRDPFGVSATATSGAHSGPSASSPAVS